MRIAEYRQAQDSITARALRSILAILFPWKNVPVTRSAWESILGALFPIVLSARRESAILARTFYDEDRINHGLTDRFDIDLPDYEWEWFLNAMQPSYEAFVHGDMSDGQFAQTGLRAIKEVENAGRKELIKAVRDENTQTGSRIGWARVATGRETCAFCLMLVSRGPVYEDAREAGLNDEEKALELLESGADKATLRDLMTRWHPGCDCIAVPVRDINSWEGRDAWKEAEDIWKETTRNYSGVDKLNAFRRAIERGQVDPNDFAIAA
jgi:hypothetical protein